MLALGPIAEALSLLPVQSLGTIGDVLTFFPVLALGPIAEALSLLPVQSLGTIGDVLHLAS